MALWCTFFRYWFISQRIRKV